jgi:PPM family protein phosphatase
MQNPGQNIRLRSSARTSMGQVRENNEDTVHLWTRDDYVLAVVADGMGGAVAGEKASQMAVDAIKDGLSIRDSNSPEAIGTMGDDSLSEKLRDAIRIANQHIMESAAAAPELKGMGTTVTLAFVRKTNAVVAHVGDSRAYLVDGLDHAINQITADHSFVEALLAAGHITQEQAEEHPMRNVLYRALGQAENLDVDVYFTRLHVGDRMVLCSDGLTRHVKPAEIAELAMSDSNPDVASQKLIDLANKRGGEDNVSVIVISVEQDGVPTPPGSETAKTIEDDDDTLVLKDRAELFRDRGESIEGGAVPHWPDLVPTDDEDEDDDTLIDFGEDELNDTADELEHDPLDEAISTRPPTLIDPPPLLRTPDTSSQADTSEGVGEGHDTLTPDQ